MQRSEFSDSRGSAMAPLHAQPQTGGAFRCSVRFEGGFAPGSTRGDPVTDPAQRASQKTSFALII